jgi:hypothetical protein
MFQEFHPCSPIRLFTEYKKIIEPKEITFCLEDDYKNHIITRLILILRSRVGPYRKCCHVQTKAPGDDF